MRVIITGAAGALGGAVRKRFEDAGDRAACLDRTTPFSTDASADTWIACSDLADPAAAEAAIAEAVKALGTVDALIHLAGAFAWMRVADAAMQDWRALYSANVETTLSVVQACLPFIVDGGSIVTVGSASARPAGVGMAPYAGAKSAVLSLTEALSQELRPRHIRVNAVLPAIINTQRNRQDMPDADPRDWTSPAAIADVIHFLSSPVARAINGAHVPVTNAV